MIFDVKMDNFRRKARLVAGGHMKMTPATMTYAIVVSHETVCLELFISVLNDLEVKCRDMMNSYITAQIGEKFWTFFRPEFGDDARKRALIVRDFYSLKSAGDSFRAHLVCCMQGLGYEPCLADPELWRKA